MIPERWFEIRLVLSIVSFFLLIIAVPIYGATDNLSESATIFAWFYIPLTVVYAVGIGYARQKREKIALIPVSLITFVTHIGVCVIMIKEWSEEECDEHIFALCTDGVTNFLAVFLIDLVVQMIFLFEYKMIWIWKNQLIEEKRPKPVFSVGVDLESGTGPDTTVENF